MPIAFTNTTIQLVRATMGGSGFEPTPTITTVDYLASVKETANKVEGAYPGQQYDIVVAVELSSTPNTELDRVRYNSNDYKIVRYNQSIYMTQQFTLYCQKIRSNN